LAGISSNATGLAGRRTAQPAAARWKSRAGNAARVGSTSLLIPLFVVSLAIPLHFYAGPMRLSPYRALLIILLIPCILAWLSGRLGKIRLPDVLMLLCPIWGALALTIHHGLAEWESSGILFIETFGAYLLARWLIRTQEDFRAMVRAFFWLVCALLPFALIESLTYYAPLLEGFSVIGEAIVQQSPDPRMGLHRAQVAFEHPILYGVFTASGFGLVYYVMAPAHSAARPAVFRSAIVVVAAICSLSSGAVTSVASQFGLAAWDRITRTLRNRWRLLAILCIVAYVAVDIVSNRSPVEVFVSYLTFSPGTGYWRIHIWNYGSAEVLRNPVFGIGLNPWQRPGWLNSMDNFWLVVAVRYGMPAFLFLAGAVLLIIRALARMNFDDERVKACRAGLLVTLGGFVIAAGTVHFWNAVYVWFMFVIGSGLWMLDEPSEPPKADGRGRPKREQSRARPQVRQPFACAERTHGPSV
jgi:hypothetical protein